MSTIHDALKKVERTPPVENQNPGISASPPTAKNPFNKNTPPPPQAVQENNPPEKHSRKNMLAVTLLIVLICGLGFSATYLIDHFDLFRGKKAILPAKPLASYGQSEDAKPPIVVQGIMSMGSKNVALINNEIYETGDLVQGVKILGISLDQITILEADQKKNIRVSK